MPCGGAASDAGEELGGTGWPCQRACLGVARLEYRSRPAIRKSAGFVNPSPSPGSAFLVGVGRHPGPAPEDAPDDTGPG